MTIQRKGGIIAEADGNERFITETELKKHNGTNGSQTWIVIKDRVYNVSNFGKEHPGGTIVFTHAGQDATDVFNAFHPASVHKSLPRFYIGDMIKDSSVTPSDAQIEADYRQDIISMKSELMKA